MFLKTYSLLLRPSPPPLPPPFLPPLSLARSLGVPRSTFLSLSSFLLFPLRLSLFLAIVFHHEVFERREMFCDKIEGEGRDIVES